MWFLTIDPFIRISVSIAKLSERQYCWRVFETFIVKNISNSLTYTVDSSCVCISQLAVVTVVGLRDFVKVSISAEFKSFLLIMCIDAPESTTNSRSSGLRFDAGKHLFSEGEKNAAFFFSLNFRTLLASLHAASRAPRSCHSVFKFWRIGVTLMRFTWANRSERRVLVSNVSVTCNGFREFYTSDRFPYV